jgi:D-sedoheptulose 7-phosphate isomerase
MREIVTAALNEASSALAALMADERAQTAIADAGRLLVAACSSGNRIFSCGNGGSMCDAMHFAEELSGRFRRDRPALAAVAISDPAHITCTANDYGFDQVFSRYVEAHGREGDVLVAISTSGESRNVLHAADRARAMGLKIVALTGKPGSSLGRAAHVEVCTPAGTYSDRVQELHIKVIHILLELVERAMFPGNYAHEAA